MTERPKPKIELTADDLHTPEIDARIEEMRAANQPRVVQSVGLPSGPSVTPKASGLSWLKGNTFSLGVAGLVGGIAGWGIAELVSSIEPEDTSNIYFWTALWTGLFALGLGAALSGWEGVQAQSWQKAAAGIRRALPIAVLGGIVGGLIAQKIYGDIIQDAFREAIRNALIEDKSVDEVVAGLRSSIHVGRTIGFGLLGGCVGVALGYTTKAKQRMINGAIGGVAGGVVGGFLFDFIDIGSGAVSRLVALTITGLVVGIAIGLVEAVRKEFWLEVISGGMAGKQFIIYHDSTAVGSAPDCHVTLIKDPGISPAHMWLMRGPRGVVAQVAGPQPVFVNGGPVAEAVLTDGDLIQVGQTLLRFGEKAPTVVMPGPLRQG